MFRKTETIRPGHERSEKKGRGYYDERKTICGGISYGEVHWFYREGSPLLRFLRGYPGEEGEGCSGDGLEGSLRGIPLRCILCALLYGADSDPEFLPHWEGTPGLFVKRIKKALTLSLGKDTKVKGFYVGL